jgi:acyl-CoA thioesterase-1
MLSLGLGMGLTEPSVSGGSGGGGVAPLTQPSFVVAGDSITSNGGTLSGTVATLIPRGYWCWAAQTSRHRMRPAYQVNAGVSGNQASQLLARYTTDVINKAPQVVFLLIGTNDIVTGGRTAAAILADIDAMITANRGIGAITVLGKILPRGLSGSPMTADQISRWEQTNAGIAARAATDVRVWDAESVIGNMDANHTIANNMTTNADGLHPNTRGGQLIGGVVASIIEDLTTATDPLFTTDNAVGNLLPGGFLTGTGGTLAGGLTGQTATGWAGTATLAGGATCVAAKVARGDGFGEWQQFTVSGTYTGTGRSVNINRTVTGLSIPAGNKISFACEFEVDSNTALSSAVLVATMNSGALSSTALNPFTGEVNSPAAPYSGVIKTQPFVAGSTVTQMQVFVRLNFLDTATTDPVSIVGRFGRVEARDLGA